MSAPSSPPHGVADGRSGVSSGASPDPSGTDGSGDLRAELAELVAHPPTAQVRGWRPDKCTRCGWAGEAADRVIEAGWRRVTEDPDEVERIARSISEQALIRYSGSAEGLDWDSDTEESRDEFRFIARAAVAAVLRGGAQ